MPEGERAFQVDEVTECDEQGVKFGCIEAFPAVLRLAKRRRPGVAGGRDREDRGGVVDERVDDHGIELTTAAASGHGHRAVGAIGALMDFDHVGQLRHPDGDRNAVAADSARQSSPVVALEGVGQRVAHAVVDPKVSASMAADAQCEWIIRDSCPRAFANEGDHAVDPVE